jgi:proteasome lid subunit RPN8/RPN11
MFLKDLILSFTKAIRMIPIEEQIANLQDFYSLNEVKTKVFEINLFPKVTITLDLKKYPKKPKISFSKKFSKIFGDMEKFLPEFRNWDKANPVQISSILIGMKLTIESITGELVHISESLFKELASIARSTHPKETFCVLRLIDGVFQEYVLAPQMQSSETSAIFYPNRIGRDKSILASCHSHPSGSTHPSRNDFQTFRYKPVNIILGNPYNVLSVGVFDSMGQPIAFQIE